MGCKVHRLGLGTESGLRIERKTKQARSSKILNPTKFLLSMPPDHQHQKSSSRSHKRSHPSPSSSPSSVHGHHPGQTHRSSSHRSRSLPENVQPISLDDFFTKSLEFKFWLKHKKKKFIDQLESSKSKKYFGKFVRHWNDGRLDQDYYNPLRTDLDLPTYSTDSEKSDLTIPLVGIMISNGRS